ncbi:hypothetical protein [Corynebacterium sp. HMSC30G07]
MGDPSPGPQPMSDALSRQKLLEEAVVNNRLEGLTVSAPTRADGQRWVDGLISADELVKLTRARYGLH